MVNVDPPVRPSSIVPSTLRSGRAPLGRIERPPAPEKQADDIFREGEELLAKGKYDAARQKYTSVKEKDPEKKGCGQT